MNRFVGICALRLFALSMPAAVGAWASSPAYYYKIVAQTGDVIDGVILNQLSSPFISDDGTVLFIGDDASGVNAGAIFSKRADGGKGSVLAKYGEAIDGYILNQFFGVKQNDSGEVVFNASYIGGSGIFRKKRKVAAIGDTIDGLTINPSYFSSFDLNDSGEIVFPATYPAADQPLGYGYGIFTPHRAIVQSGDTIDGVTLGSIGGLALSKSGVVAFGSGNSIFTQHRVVVTTGDTVDGLTLFRLSAPAISELGAIGYEAVYGDSAYNYGADGYFVDGRVIAKSGDTIDGLTLVPLGDPVAPLGGLTLNAAGEALFESNALDANGNLTGGWFTQHHSVVVHGDTVAGVMLGDVYGASINDSGQIAFIAEAAGTAVIVATPKKH